MVSRLTLLAALVALPVLNIHVLLPWLERALGTGTRNVWWLDIAAATALHVSIVLSIALSLRSMSEDWAFIGFHRPTRTQMIGLLILGLATVAVIAIAPTGAHPSALGLGPHTKGEFRFFVAMSMPVAALQEPIFRGYPIASLRKVRMPTWLAVACSTASWAYYHDGFSALNTVIGGCASGLILAALYLRTRSLWWPLILHAAFDLAVFALALES